DLGTLYLLNYSETLELQCSHAAIDSTLIPKFVHLGQNRLGTAAEKMEPVILDHVPDDYLAVGSSIGKSQPAYLLLIPLVQNGQIEGVMEIASFMPFNS